MNDEAFGEALFTMLVIGFILGWAVFWLVPTTWPYVKHWLHAVTA